MRVWKTNGLRAGTGSVAENPRPHLLRPLGLSPAHQPLCPSGPAVFSLQDMPVPCQKSLAELSTGTQCLSRPPFTVMEGPGALHLSASLSPFLSVSPSLLSGFGLGPAMASGLAVLRLELLDLWGLMGVHGPACWVVFPLCQKQG